MSLRERIVRRLGGDVLTEVAQAAAKAALAEASFVDPDEHLWRSLSETRRDLPSYTHERAQNIAYILSQQNALGHRLTELMPDFIVGDGITWSCTNPDVREVVEEWWTDDVNDLEMRQHQFALELGMYGELLPEALTGEVSGVVQLGYIDPGQVKRIEALADNPLVMDKVVAKIRADERTLDVIRDRGAGRLEGEIFLFKVNSVSNATRGWPDLLHVADWLDMYDQLLWEMVERARLARSFIWDVEIDGDDAEVKKYAKEHGKQPPRSGSIRIHNKKVKWTAVAPQLGSFEAAAEAEIQLAHIAGSFGVPKHWLSATADVNRATAVEQGAPSVRKLARRQKYFVSCLRRMVRYTVEQATLHKRIPSDDGLVPLYDENGNETGETAPAWKSVRLHAPEISPRDSYRAGQLLLQLTQALAAAEEKGWFGKDTSRRAVAAALSQMGVEFQPNNAPDEGDQAPTEEDTPEPANVAPIRRG